MKREFRFGFTPEVRENGNSPRITGYAAIFDEETDLGPFREVIKPGAFKRSLNAGADVRALVEHDPAMIIGRSKANTLRMQEDHKGLRVEITPPDTQVGRDVITNLRNGNLDKMSFGFYVKDQEMKKVDGTLLREIRDVDLFDVSIVSFPAYDGTSVQARSSELRAMFPDGIPETLEPGSRSTPIRAELRRRIMKRRMAEIEEDGKRLGTRPTHNLGHWRRMLSIQNSLR